MDFKELSFEFTLDGEPFNPSPEDFDLVIRDSIHSFFCGGKFSLLDHSSVFQEYRMLNDGMPFEAGFTYIDKEENPTTSFIIDNYEGTKNLQFGILSPKIETVLNHANANLLNTKSAAYPGSISDILEDVLADLEFEDVLIASTSGTRTWYQPYMNAKEFIENILLKRAYTDSEPFSPFFAFTTSDNIFHFEDLATLLKKSSKQEFIYRPVTDIAPAENQLSTIEPFSNGVSNGRKSWNRTIHKISRVDFAEEEETRLLSDRLKEDPLIIGTSDQVTDFMHEEFFTPDDTADQARTYGKENYKSRRVFFQDSFRITTMKPFTDLHSGDKITLKVATRDSSGYADSLYFSGDYLIETASHHWNGKLEKGYSEFLISRGSFTIPNDHLVSEKVFK